MSSTENVPLDALGHPGTSQAQELPDDPRLLQAVQEYLNLMESGQRPDRQEFLRRYPDLAEPLAECLAGLELVHKNVGRDRMPASALAGPSLRPPEPTPGNPLGDFQIVREIGRGGMGVVYEAVQLSLGRRVALKVLPFAATFDARHLERFRNEAQAAAHLHHTNIVPVYAVGCERGVHFYAMQLIEGQSLALVIQQLRQQAGRPVDEEESARPATYPVGLPTGSSSHPVLCAENAAGRETVWQLSLALSTQRSGRGKEFYRAAARFALQAAEALEHAHQQSIVHRDVKPANLMVDERGRLWVTDFGLALFHAEARLTQTGDTPGTLRYMSPEQASGQRILLDHRTDIYALGATLYELVTLEPIFAARNRHVLLHLILHEEPRLPRALEKAVPVELETIILKAISKSPADRYASAQDLAADLRRYLEDRPILAKRPRLLERFRKWSRRHPSVVGAGVVVLLLCIAGLLVNNGMISREQAKTEAALQGEKRRASEARQALNLLVQVAEEELGEEPHLQGPRRRLLETALNYYQDFLSDDHGSDTYSQAELEAGEKRVRRILDELATLQGAQLLGLVTDQAVQADVKVTEAQREQLTALSERASAQRLALFREQGALAPEARRQKFYALAKEQEAALSGILGPKQVRRLRQIAVQMEGPRAFHDAFAVAVLKLTPEQRRRVREFKDMAMASLRGGSEPCGPDDLGKRTDHAPIEGVMKAELERILAILTPEQKNLWQELIGAPFHGSRRMPPPGMFGPPGSFGPPPGRKRDSFP